MAAGLPPCLPHHAFRLFDDFLRPPPEAAWCKVSFEAKAAVRRDDRPSVVIPRWDGPKLTATMVYKTIEGPWWDRVEVTTTCRRTIELSDQDIAKLIED